MSCHGFRVAYWDEQGLWPKIGRYVQANNPLNGLSIQVPSQLIISSRSTSIAGTSLFREVTVAEMSVSYCSSSSPDVVLKSSEDELSPQLTSRSPHVLSSAASAASTTTNPVVPVPSLSKQCWTAAGWLETGPDISASTIDNADVPVVHLYLFKCDSFDLYKVNIKPVLKKWAEKLGDQGEEILIFFVTIQEGNSVSAKETAQIKTQRKLFEKIRADLITSIESSFSSLNSATGGASGLKPPRVRSMKERVFRVPVYASDYGPPATDSPTHLTSRASERTSDFRGLPSSDPAFSELWELALRKLVDCVAAGISGRIAAEASYKETQQSTTARAVRAKYTSVFHATERLAGSLFRCGLYPETLGVYDSLDLRMADSHTTAKRYRTLFHNCGLPGLGSDPVIFDVDSRGLRKLIHTDAISYVDFRQYLFTRQCQVLHRMGRLDKVCSRSLSFVSSFSMDLLSFVTLPGKEEASQLREASVRAFLLILLQNLLIRLLALGTGEDKEVTLPSKVRFSTSPMRERSHTFGSTQLERSMTDKSGVSGVFDKSSVLPPVKLRDRSMQGSLYSSSQMQVIALQQLWCLIRWRIREGWRPLTSSVSSTPPSTSVDDWREQIATHCHPKVLGLMLSDLDTALKAELAIFEKAVMLLERNGFQRQLTSLRCLHDQFFLSIGHIPDVVESTPTIQELNDLANLSEENHPSLFMLRLVQLFLSAQDKPRTILANLIIWLLCWKDLPTLARTKTLRLIEGHLPYKLNDEDQSVITDTTEATDEWSSPLSMFLSNVECLRAQSTWQSIMTFQKKQVGLLGSRFCMPACPNLYVTLDIVNTNDESVLVADIHVTRRGSISPSAGSLSFDTNEFDLERTMNFGNATWIISPPAVMPPMRVRADESRRSSKLDASPYLRGAVKDGGVPFAEPLTFRILIKSNLSEAIPIRQVWIKLTNKIPPADTSPSKRKEFMALWFCVSPTTERFFLVPPGYGYIEFRWVPTVTGNLTFTQTVLVPYLPNSPPNSMAPGSSSPVIGPASPMCSASPMGSVSVSSPLGSVESNRAVESHRGGLFYLYSRQIQYTQEMELILRALRGAKEPRPFSLFPTARRALEVQSPRHVFAITITNQDAETQNRLFFGRLNYLLIQLKVGKQSQLTGPCRMSIQLRWKETQHSKNLRAAVMASSLLALEIDGKQTKSSDPIARCVPSGSQSDGWVVLPLFQEMITVLVPVDVSSPYEFEERPLSPPRREIRRSETTVESRTPKSRSGSLPRLQSFRNNVSPPKKEAAVLVPRHVRSPSVRSFSRQAEDDSPPIVALGSPEFPAEIGSQEITVTVRLRSSASSNARELPPPENLPSLAATRVMPAVISLGAGCPSTCLDKTPPSEAPVLPKLNEVSNSGYFIDQMTTSSYTVESLFVPFSEVVSRDARQSVYVIGVRLVETPGTRIVCNSISLHRGDQGRADAARYQYLRLELITANGVTRVDLSKRQVISFPAVQLTAGQTVSAVLIARYPEASAFRPYELAQWQGNPVCHLLAQWGYEVAGDENRWVTRQKVEVHIQPSPIVISHVECPLEAELGQFVKLLLRCENLSKYSGSVRFNVILAFDTNIDEDSEDDNRPAPSCWQLLGYKCTSQKVAAGGSLDLAFDLIPVKPGLLTLPPLKLSAWLDDETGPVSVPITGWTRRECMQVKVISSSAQRLMIHKVAG